jgi:hypothetical protein
MEGGGGMTVELTAAERDLLARRKSPELTPREFLQATELQVRVHLRGLPESVERTAMLAECAGLQSQIAAADFNTAGMGYLNGLGQSLMVLHQKALGLK